MQGAADQMTRDHSSRAGLARLSLLAAWVVLTVLACGPATASAGQLGWFGPISPESNGLVGVACPSSTQCTAVDLVGGQVTFDPTEPGNATPTTVDAGDWLRAVACPSTTQCTAVGEPGGVTFDPTEPGSQTLTAIGAGNSWRAVCPSTTQCTAVGNSEEVTFNPTEPPSPTEPPTAPGGEITTAAGGGLTPNAMVCRSASQCTADDTAVEVRFKGQRITVTAPSMRVCVAPGKQLGVDLSSVPIEHSQAAELTFSAAVFYLDSGVRRTHKQTEATNGQKATVIVTTYSANAAVRRVPATVEPSAAGLKPGVNALTIKLYYRETRDVRGHRLPPVTQTLHAKFRVC